MELVTGLTVLKTASDLTTRIREALGSREVKLDEVVARIIEVQGLISDGRTALIEVQEQLLGKNREIFALEQENRSFQEQLTKKRQGRIHDNAAWKILDDDSEEGPYCPNCYEKTRNFIQPTRGSLNGESVIFFCTDHEKVFYFRVPIAVCGEVASDRSKPVPIRRPGSPWA